jgi:hypothetical protein
MWFIFISYSDFDKFIKGHPKRVIQKGSSKKGHPKRVIQKGSSKKGHPKRVIKEILIIEPEGGWVKKFFAILKDGPSSIFLYDNVSRILTRILTMKGGGRRGNRRFLY